jgi:hypothetical protein
MDDLDQFAYRPCVILDGVFEIPPNTSAESQSYAVTNEELEEAERRVSLSYLLDVSFITNFYLGFITLIIINKFLLFFY